MSHSITRTLIDLLKLERLSEQKFRALSLDLGFGAIFGGQLLAQGLSAAMQTVEQDRWVHSLHAYFYRPGHPKIPLDISVESYRDGKHFSMRMVQIFQKQRAIFSLAASFQKSEGGMDHQKAMPTALPKPENLPTDNEYFQELIAQKQIPSHLRAHLLEDRPIEIRPIDPMDIAHPRAKAPHKYQWIRAKSLEALEIDERMHLLLMTYASDFGLLGVTLYPHGRTYWQRQMKMASLDHAMWFHRKPRMDDWLLYVMDSPSASGGRGLARGTIYNRQGELLASVAQEGMIRWKDKDL